MPPRRSSRTTRISVELAPAPVPVPRKRKRIEEDPDKQEVGKPPSRTRRSTSGPSRPATARKASRKASSARKTSERPANDIDSDLGEEESKHKPTLTQVDPIPSAPLPTQSPEPEEERSLFDSLPLPPPPALPKVISEDPSAHKARLVIYKMALVNFKSYAGRQEIGPFHKSFSSIVGPNGSGKSNTIDALLFVFGYRASKMRQGKLSELIHNSAQFPDLGECSVEVHFREIVDLPGRDDFEVVPDSQLIVTRAAAKNNSSRYTINGKTSSYTEVQTLLKGRGIDLDHNRFLILQGEVESIALMKPKATSEHDDGLLEYLEDIIGTARFKEPIEEALVEMERLNEDRGVKLNRLRIVEKEKAALEKQKKEAEDYLRLRNEHVRAQSRLFQWILWRALINEQEYDTAIARLKKELESETERNKDDIMHLDMLKKHYEEREKTYAEVQAAAKEAVKDLTAHEKQEVGLQERKKHASGKAKKLRKSVQDDTSARAQALRDIDDNGEKIDKHRTEAEMREAELVTEERALEGIRDSLKGKTQKFHDQIEKKQRELQPWITQINERQAEIDIASSEKEALIKKAEAAEAARKDAEDNLNGLKTDHEVKLREHEKLKVSRANLQRETNAAEKVFQDCRKNAQELKAKAVSSRQKVDEAKASQADNRSQGRVLDSLTRLQAAGRINGFYGRLGSLGTIEDKYDIAISTAAPSLHHMVVDHVEQGQACIDYLRSQNAGRASFIVLDKLPHSGSGMNKISTPENVPRLFDLVKPKEPKFLPAFYKAVGDTLVAKDMEQANRIAFGARRWRVVTLAGQLIDTAGTMSGGGNQPARGAMSSKLAAEIVRPEVLRKYEEDCHTAAKKADEAQQDLKRAEEELERLRTSGPQIEVALQKLGMDIENSQRRIEDAEKRVQEVRSQSKPNASDAARISDLEKTITKGTSQLEKLKANAAGLQQDIKNLEDQILQIGGSKLLAQKAKVDGIKVHINLANEQLTKAEVAKAKAEKDAVKLESAIKTNAVSLDEADAEVAELSEQLKTLGSYLDQLRDKVEAAQSAADNSKEDLDSLKAKLDNKEQEIAQFRKKEMEIKQELADTEKEARENGQKIEHWQREHDKLRLEEIDDDDDDEDDETEKREGSKGPTEQSAEPADVEVKTEPSEPRPMKPVKKESSMELHIYSAEELAKFKKREMVADVELLDENLKNSKPDLNVLKEYRRREAEFLNRAKDLDMITKERDAQKQKYDGLRKQRLDEFMAGFNMISLKLKEMYQMITLGGNAELELVDSMDPFSEGIIFSVMPPKKSWKNISNLSGGEKTLSSLALVFALHVFKPTPLYFMDEIDAALDFRNVSIVANYIKDRTKNAQFIIISLRNDMFELSHRLIGIYKTNNTTKSISIDNHTLVAPSH